MAWHQRVLVVAVMLALRSSVAATPNRGDTDDFKVIEIRSDDTPETASAFLRAAMQVLTGSKIRLRFHCTRQEFPTGSGTSTALFVANEDGISLRLLSTTHEQSTRRIPWLDDARRPLAKTLAVGKATTLGLFLESLAADLQGVALRPLPGLPAPESAGTPPSSASERGEPAPRSPSGAPSVETPSSPERVAEPRAATVATSTTRPEPSPLAPRRVAETADRAVAVFAPPPTNESSAKRPDSPAGDAKPTFVARPPVAATGAAVGSKSAPSPRRLEISLPLVGIDWMPPSTVAPQFETGAGWGGPRWWAIAHALVQLDSNFAMGWRTFHTMGYGARLGLRRTLFRSERFRWDADGTVVGHLSQYRRDGIAHAQTQDWFDLGAGLHSRTVFRFARHASALLSLGGQLFPTARLASIPGGPSRRINLVTLSVVGGLSFDF
jgi:hypothetical protein